MPAEGLAKLSGLSSFLATTCLPYTNPSLVLPSRGSQAHGIHKLLGPRSLLESGLDTHAPISFNTNMNSSDWPVHSCSCHFLLAYMGSGQALGMSNLATGDPNHHRHVQLPRVLLVQVRENFLGAFMHFFQPHSLRLQRCPELVKGSSSGAGLVPSTGLSFLASCAYFCLKRTEVDHMQE